MSGEAVILGKNQNASEKSGMVAAPPLIMDESYPLTQDVSRGITRYTFKSRTPLKISRNSRPKQKTRRPTMMSPPWPHVNGTNDGPVRDSHIFKTSSGGRQLCSDWTEPRWEECSCRPQKREKWR